MVALGSDKQELFECHMEASRNGNFQIVSNARMVLVGKVSSLVHSTDSRSPGCVGGGGEGGVVVRVLPEQLGGLCNGENNNYNCKISFITN